MARASKWSKAYRERTGRPLPAPAVVTRHPSVSAPSDAELERLTAPSASPAKPDQKRK